MKSFKEYIEEIVSTTSITSTGAMKVHAHGKAFGLDYFECDSDTFEKCRSGGKAHRKHWMKFLSNKDIQQFAKQNKNKSFLIKRQGSEDYLRAR